MGGSGGAGGDGGARAHEQVSCAGAVFACGDGADNDGDGLIDADDPDCLSPCQDSESSFSRGRPEAGELTCTLDCYFDADVGSGNDQCRWSHRCDSNGVAPDFHPAGNACAYDPATLVAGQSCTDMSAAQSPTCQETCGPVTPNGCDCFGCCELPAGSGTFVYLGSQDAQGNSSCDLDGALDPSRCRPCQPVPSCLNPCEECELCVGKPTLPDGCGDVEPSCPAGIEACGPPPLPTCADGTYCVTGCCQALPL